MYRGLGAVQSKGFHCTLGASIAPLPPPSPPLPLPLLPTRGEPLPPLPLRGESHCLLLLLQPGHACVWVGGGSSMVRVGVDWWLGLGWWFGSGWWFGARVVVWERLPPLPPLPLVLCRCQTLTTAFLSRRGTAPQCVQRHIDGLFSRSASRLDGFDVVYEPSTRVRAPIHARRMQVADWPGLAVPIQKPPASLADPA